MQALEEIKVLDFCRNAPGMFCTTVLADLGADVLMIERPMDETRSAYEKLVVFFEPAQAFATDMHIVDTARRM